MTTTPAPQHRIEWCGNVKVYIPITPQPAPDAHTLRTVLSVACA